MDWNIKGRSEQCAETGHPFQEGKVFYTILEETKEGIQRKDLCAEAWNKISGKPAFFWRSTFKTAPAKAPETINKQDAESELRRLLNLDARENDKLCYLLALLLERKKILRAREKTELEGEKVIFYEHSDTQETFIIRETDFKLSDIENLQTELSSSSSIFSKGSLSEAP